MSFRWKELGQIHIYRFVIGIGRHFSSSLSYVTINQRKNDAPFLLSWRIWKKYDLTRFFSWCWARAAFCLVSCALFCNTGKAGYLFRLNAASFPEWFLLQKLSLSWPHRSTCGSGEWLFSCLFWPGIRNTWSSWIGSEVHATGTAG